MLKLSALKFQRYTGKFYAASARTNGTFKKPSDDLQNTLSNPYTY